MDLVPTAIKEPIMVVSRMVIRFKAMDITHPKTTTRIHTPPITATTVMMMTGVARDIMTENMIETNGRKPMTKQYSHKTASSLSMAILLAISTASWADHDASASQTLQTQADEKLHSTAHWNHARQISKQKQQQLVKEAVDAVMETENALTDLNNKKSKEALLKLNDVSAKLQSLLTKDSQLKLVPVSFQEQTFIYEGNLDDVKATAHMANELIEDQRIQEARQLLDRLTSEIRINVIELPLSEYPIAIDKAKSLIMTGKQDDAAGTLTDVLDKLVAHVEIYPLPVLAAESDLTEAFELEHKTDHSKPESKDNILKLADKSENQLELAEALGYGEKKDYEVLYEGIQALRDTLHTDKFKAEWDKVKSAISHLKEKIVHPGK
jgi:hypothetical protein